MSANPDVLNLDHFTSDFFRRAICDHVAEYRDYYGDRLASVYIRGSVFRNEGVVGVSDLDILVFIWDEFTDEDRSYWIGNREKLESEYPGTHGLGFACPVHRMKSIASLLSQLKYDAALVFGSDLVGDMDVPYPDYFHRLWLLVRFLSGVDETNRSESAMPSDPGLRLRRLARMSVTAAAGLLRATDELDSYRCVDVLPRVLDRCPEFMETLLKTSLHYDKIVPTTPAEVHSFESGFLAWAAWVGAQRASWFNILLAERSLGELIQHQIRGLF